MITTIPNIEAYPKTVLLKDGTHVTLRLLVEEDRSRLLSFFRRIPEQERFYLKEDVTSPEVIQSWTTGLDFSRVVPILALVGDEIVADGTLHRSRALARCGVGELRIVVDPSFREVGLGRRLMRELLDVALDLGLNTATFELIAKHEGLAITAARSLGFHVVATLKDRIRDLWGDYQDLIVMELPLRDYERSFQF